MTKRSRPELWRAPVDAETVALRYSEDTQPSDDAGPLQRSWLLMAAAARLLRWFMWFEVWLALIASESSVDRWAVLPEQGDLIEARDKAGELHRATVDLWRSWQTEPLWRAPVRAGCERRARPGETTLGRAADVQHGAHELHLLVEQWVVPVRGKPSRMPCSATRSLAEHAAELLRLLEQSRAPE
jgi:hypothetical protein